MKEPGSRTAIRLAMMFLIIALMLQLYSCMTTSEWDPDLRPLAPY